MRKFFITLILCIAFSSLSFAASIEQEKMLESIKKEQEEEQQKQREQQTLQPIYNIIVPGGYYTCPDGDKHHPYNRPHPKPHLGGKPNFRPCPIGK